MKHELRYGAASSLQLEFPAGALMAALQRGPGAALADPGEATTAALHSPLNFPPLSRAVIPSDTVVIALDPEVPQAASVVTSVVEALLAAGVEADNITLLQANQPSPPLCHTTLSDAARQVQLAQHDPGDASQMAYLAAARDASPILLNRRLCDADVVIPIHLARPASAILYAGPHGGLCPTFSDTATQQRFRAPQLATHPRRRHERLAEAAEVSWLLGVQFAVQVVAAGGDRVLHVLAGNEKDVRDEAQALAAAAWEHHVGQRAELVMAAIDGGAWQQTWQNVARALAAARQVCTERGTIVLCTELNATPGPALRRLAGFEEPAVLRARIAQDRSEDAALAWLLLDLRDAHHVCLLSRLEQADVEALGIAYVETPDHLERLCRQAASCILIENAQQATVREEG